MRKKKVPTRKRRAFRWLCAAVLLVLVNNILHDTYYVLPIQNLWKQEEILGCGRTDVLRRTWDPAAKDLIYLSANEKAVILLGESLGLSGWNTDNWGYLDCTDAENSWGNTSVFDENTNKWKFLNYTGGGNVQGNICIFGRNTKAPVWYAYGLVDDPAVTEIRLSVRFAVLDTGDHSYQEAKTSSVSTTADDWFWQDGKRYFLLRNELEGPGEGRIVSLAGTALTALDANGETIAELCH